MENRYIFQEGGEADDTAFFNQYMDQLIQQQAMADDSETVDVQVDEDEDSDFIRNLRSYDDEQLNYNKHEELNEKISRLEQLLDEKMNSFSQKIAEYDWFTDEDGQEYMQSMYDTRNNTTPYNMDHNQTLKGIFKPEGASVGQRTNVVNPNTGRRGSALGRGQMIEATRKRMYKKLGITNINEAESRFRTDPAFEEQILNTYVQELDGRIPKNIQGVERQRMIAKGWYTGNPFVSDNYHPGAGNKLTAGQYADQATK